MATRFFKNSSKNHLAKFTKLMRAPSYMIIFKCFIYIFYSDNIAQENSSSGSSRALRKRGRKQFLPKVLKEDDVNHEPLFRRPIVTADSATFAHEPVAQPVGGDDNTIIQQPLPAAYGSTEMTSQLS